MAVELRPPGAGRGSGPLGHPLLQRTLPAAPVGITLLPLAGVAAATIWESSFVYGDAAAAAAAAADPLSFVESAAPPALSLLVPGGTAEDATVQANLRQLCNACGGTVSTAELARNFWPRGSAAQRLAGAAAGALPLTKTALLA